MHNKTELCPAISVVFTSYNHKEYLSQALDALLNQTFVNFELIIVDDCSTDGSQEILKDYAKKDERIRLFLNKENSGSYVNSTNYGVTLAVAPYIVLAQCDDFAFPDQLQKLYSARLNNEECQVVFSSSVLVDEQGKAIDIDYNLRKRKFREAVSDACVIDRKVATELLLNECIIPNLGAALIDRSLYNVVGGLSTSYKVLADWDFWLNCSLISDFVYLKSPLNNFRQHKTTIRSSVRTELQLNELYDIFKKYKEKDLSLTNLYINKSIGILFWGMVTPISIRNSLGVIKLSIKAVSFHFALPFYIYLGLIRILYNKIMKYMQEF